MAITLNKLEELCRTYAKIKQCFPHLLLLNLRSEKAHCIFKMYISRATKTHMGVCEKTPKVMALQHFKVEIFLTFS